MIALYEPHITLRHKWAVIRQLLSGWIGPGKTCEAFASLMCETVGRQHCTLTNSGTSALMLAYLALDLKPGATVCCPAYGFPAAHNAARLLGLNVKLIDVDPATANMDAEKLAQWVTVDNRIPESNPSAVVFVDHNGCTAGLKDVADMCRRWGIPLIEDSAVALGSPGAGITGDLAIYSFSVPKIVTSGQGGAVLTDNPALAKRLEQLVDQGGDWRQDRIHKAIGGNFRLADLNAALGLAQLRDLPRLIEKRNRLWGWYREVLPIHNDPGAGKSGWMVTRKINALGRIMERTINKMVMAEYGATNNTAPTGELYKPLCYCKPYEEPSENFHGAMSYYMNVGYLPSSLSLTRNQVREICNA